MPNHPLFHPVPEATRTAAIRDQVQMALAIADAKALKSLLVHAIPPIAQPHQIGEIAAKVAVPTRNQAAADGILQFEAIQCVLADTPHRTDLPPTDWLGDPRERARLTQYESDLQTYGQNLAFAPLVALLATAGFAPKQIEAVLHLPQDGWHKSWWWAIDPNGNFAAPFLRQIRVLHYANGTFTLQYRDFFEQDKPPCFTSLLQEVLVFIKPDLQSFSETLRQINEQRTDLQLTHTVLICNTLSDLEAQAFINQGVSIYPAIELVLPLRSGCDHCGRQECPMNGREASPIALCHGYLPISEFV